MLVIRNWLIGRRIVEQEQEGQERAGYGKQVIELASQSLTAEYGRGFSVTSIKNMRSFYNKFRNLQIGQAALDQFNIAQFSIGQPLLDQSAIPFYPNPTFTPKKKIHENKAFFDHGKFAGHSTRLTKPPLTCCRGNAPRGGVLSVEFEVWSC